MPKAAPHRSAWQVSAWGLVEAQNTLGRTVLAIDKAWGAKKRRVQKRVSPEVVFFEDTGSRSAPIDATEMRLGAFRCADHEYKVLRAMSFLFFELS